MSDCLYENCEKFRNNEPCDDDIRFCEKTLAEHDAKVRADALEDYRKWVKDSPECDDRPCNGMCIECFIGVEKEKKNE